MPDESFSILKSLVSGVALIWSTAVLAALPGVTEFAGSPEKITDSQLTALMGKRVNAADVIAIGESVHGSSGFLAMQTRLIRHLVDQHGLRLIVWENPTLRSVELAQWVSSCTRTKSVAPLDVLYWPTVSDAALWDWVCEFNLRHPDNPVVFRGMDVWDRPWEHHARIQTLGMHAGVASANLAGVRTFCAGHDASSWAEMGTEYSQPWRDGKLLPRPDYEKCRGSLTALYTTARRTGLEKRKQNDADYDAAFELALSASTLLGWLGFYHYAGSDDILSWSERDQAQGRNLMLLMEKHGAARAILAAHTSHVSHNRSAADWWGSGDLKSGVYFFGALTRKNVFNIALTAFEASGAQGSWSLPEAVNSVDKKLHDSGHRFSFFPSDAPFLKEYAKWWMQNQNFPGPYQSGVEIVPADHFDAFIFFGQSHLDKVLPNRPVWQP